MHQRPSFGAEPTRPVLALAPEALRDPQGDLQGDPQGDLQDDPQAIFMGSPGDRQGI